MLPFSVGHADSGDDPLTPLGGVLPIAMVICRLEAAGTLAHYALFGAATTSASPFGARTVARISESAC